MTMRIPAGLTMILAVAMMGLASCDHYNCASGPTLGSSCTSSGPVTAVGGGTTSGAASAFAFAVDADGTVDGYTLSTGAGTFAATTGYTGPTIPENTSGQGMVVAQGQYLYTGFPGTGQIYGWTLSSSGGLTAISGSPFSAPYMIGSTIGGTRSMITNPAGTLLFVLNQSGDTVYLYQIGSGGVLTLASGSPFPVPFLPENMATDGLGKYLYVTSASTDTSVIPAIAAYSVSSSGSLTAVSGSPFSGNIGGMLNAYGMLQVEGDPSGKYLIGTTSAAIGNNFLYVFNIQQTGATPGAITPVAGSPFATFYSPYAIAVQSNSGGDLVYSFSISSTGTTNPIEGYQLNTSTGALTAVSGSPFSSLSTGIWGQFDQSGAFLFVLDTAASQLAPFEVSSGGVLTQPIPPVTTVGGYWAVTDVP